MAGSAEISLNNAAATQYTVEFKRLPGVIYNASRCVIPGLNLGVASVPTPFKRMPFAGTEIEHGPFTMDFLVDENHSNYYEIMSWMKGAGFPDRFEQYQELEDSDDGVYSDFTVTIYNNQNNAKLRYIFTHAFPIQLGDLMLDSQVGEPDPLQVAAAFEFLNYSVEKL